MNSVVLITPLQFFVQLTIKNDHSQFLQFILPLVDPAKIFVNLGVHAIRRLSPFLLEFVESIFQPLMLWFWFV